MEAVEVVKKLLEIECCDECEIPVDREGGRCDICGLVFCSEHIYDLSFKKRSRSVTLNYQFLGSSSFEQFFKGGSTKADVEVKVDESNRVVCHRCLNTVFGTNEH